VIAAGLSVPAATYAGLWLWRSRRRRRQPLKPGTPPAETELAQLAAGISRRHEELREQLTALYLDWPKRDVGLTTRATYEKAGQAPESLETLLAAAALAAATGDRQELLQKITDFVVPGMADWCIVFLPAGDGRLKIAALSSRRQGRAAAFARLRDQPIAVRGPMTAMAAYRTGTVQPVPDIVVEVASWAEAEPALADVLAGSHAQTALAAPLTAGAQRLGVMVMGRDADRAPFADPDIAITDELSRRLAAALANADAFARERSIAETLQRSLLPETLPAISGLDLAVRYLPASGGATVGGDWYDAFPVDARRVGLVVGDVVGHSIASASVMGQVRTLLQTCTLDDPSPGGVLRRANLALARLLPEAMATVACVVLDAATGDLTYASAGHLPPLVVTTTGTEYLDGVTGIMLGTGVDAPFSARRCRLPARSGLLLYTDGLIEDRRRDVGAGMRTLAGALHQSAPRTAEQMCTIAERAMLGPAPRTDDICLLAARTRQ
jgi:serine phosphatase RsbU (regulator of sigma subunit)